MLDKVLLTQLFSSSINSQPHVLMVFFTQVIDFLSLRLKKSSREKNHEKALIQLKQIHQETQTQMQQAIKAEGLEVERFNEIVAAVQQNPTLQQQVEQMLKS